ncbi:MAG: hypothetical protein NTV32_01510 [Gammaproteobacteria bacterium]|nr:hypothetical protein [Gammaproteobacteria bacterium]
MTEICVSLGILAFLNQVFPAEAGVGDAHLNHEEALFQNNGMRINFGLAASGLFIALGFYAALSQSRSFRSGAPLPIKLLASVGENLLSSAVLINFYRDFDWAGIFSLMGLRHKPDAYHPAVLSMRDNGEICGRMAIVSTALCALIVTRQLLTKKFEERDCLKVSMRIFIETVAATFGLFAWNIPGWLAKKTHHLNKPNTENYLFYSLSQGLLEGTVQMATFLLLPALFEKMRCQPCPIGKKEINHFFKKWSWVWPGGIWNVSYLAQSMGYLPTAMLSAFGMSALTLAATVAIFNAGVAVYQSSIDSGEKSLAGFLELRWGRSLVRNHLDSKGESSVSFHASYQQEMLPLFSSEPEMPMVLLSASNILTGISMVAALAGAVLFPEVEPLKYLLLGGAAFALGVTTFRACFEKKAATQDSASLISLYE